MHLLLCFYCIDRRVGRQWWWSTVSLRSYSCLVSWWAFQCEIMMDVPRGTHFIYFMHSHRVHGCNYMTTLHPSLNWHGLFTSHCLYLSPSACPQLPSLQERDRMDRTKSTRRSSPSENSSIYTHDALGIPHSYPFISFISHEWCPFLSHRFI